MLRVPASIVRVRRSWHGLRTEPSDTHQLDRTFLISLPKLFTSNISRENILQWVAAEINFLDSKFFSSVSSNPAFVYPTSPGRFNVLSMFGLADLTWIDTWDGGEV